MSIFGIIVGFVAAFALGPLNRPVGGDGAFFISLAREIATGAGYKNTSLWPNSPEFGRMPLWPAILAIPTWLFSNANDFAILRCMTAVMHGAAAGLVTWLTYTLSVDMLAATVAGIFLAAYPPSLSFIDTGYAEPAWVVVATIGLILLLRTGWKQIAGAALLGISVLARSNFLIMPFALAFIAVIWRRDLVIRHWRRFIILSLVFFVAPTAWIIRNYCLSGRFPMLSALQGETFYGGNNDVVATDLPSWGYWLFPDNIPGETPKKVLASRMSEVELNSYYMRQGEAYLRGNWLGYPRLLLGRFIRAFWPIPWKPSLIAYLASIPRIFLYLAFLFVLATRNIRHRTFGLLLGAMFLVIITTVAMFDGTFRYTFCIEPYVIACTSIALVHLWKRKTRENTAEAQPNISSTS